MTGTESLAAAVEAIDDLSVQATRYHDHVRETRDDPKLSETYKGDVIAEARKQFDGYHREVWFRAQDALAAAEEQAERHLSGPADEATETRKARAAMRVSRLIDSGTAPLDAAEMFAERRDLDALRALRDEVPSWVVATLPPSEQPHRQKVIASTLLALDQRMQPLLSGADADAVRVRLAVESERARLAAVNEHASRPTASSQIRLAYASSVA